MTTERRRELAARKDTKLEIARRRRAARKVVEAARASEQAFEAMHTIGEPVAQELKDAVRRVWLDLGEFLDKPLR